jgi:hypothetical protein
MKQCVLFFACVATLISAALAQTVTDQPEGGKTSSPVAFVYVTRPTHIDGFAVSSSGKLTAVPGSPILAGVSSLSVSKKFLIGPDNNMVDIDVFSIASTGSLKLASTTNALADNPDGCANVVLPIQIDNTGSTIYNQVDAQCESAYLFQSFKIESNGDLQFLGNTTNSVPDFASTFNGPPDFLSNNKYAYQTGCVDFDGDFGANTEIYKRDSNGLLVDFNRYIDTPNPPDDGIYCAWAGATDSDHLVMALQNYNSDSFDEIGHPVLAVYTADSQGNLTTNSTADNMPMTDIANGVQAMSISPSGKLIAVGGQSGFQVFHFNGGSPITKYTGLLQPHATFLEFGWDSHNHLFGVTPAGLFVYTVTPTHVTEAPGSPYSIPEASNVIVLDK